MEYRRCLKCGHEILLNTDAQGFILNDPLTKKDATRVTRLDRFKTKVLRRFDSSAIKVQLVDLGSGSGKFLYQNATNYKRAFGVEITPEAFEFSKNVLGLDIKKDILEVPRGTSVATAWHSLEHIPGPLLEDMLKALHINMINNSRLIISVPNGNSRQYRWFASAYAYFDVPNHLHQFTELSITMLMERCGFSHISTINSWPYNMFGYLQSLLNIFIKDHNYLYCRFKRRSLSPSTFLDIAHILLVPFIAPLAFLLTFLDIFDIKRQGVITLCFKKKP
jgi:hypothetical protein